MVMVNRGAMIRDVAEFVRVCLGADPGKGPETQVLARASALLYAHTEHAIGLDALDGAGNPVMGRHTRVEGIELIGLGDGAAVLSHRRLMFPFSEEAFWGAAADVSDELNGNVPSPIRASRDEP
jgi:hypothetical protein